MVAILQENNLGEIMVSIIIPCLNHFDYTVKCLNSLYEGMRLDDKEIIIINDGSTDETNTELLRYLDGQYIVVKNWPTNIGFAPAVNKGIKLSSGDYICICNNDFIFSRGCIDILHNVIENSDYWMVTGYLVGDETVSPDKFLDWADVQNEGEAQLLKWHKMGPWLFKREAFNIIGLFDESFRYGQYEDTDMLMRMSLHKMLWGASTKGYAFHYGSITQHGELQNRVGKGYAYENKLKFEGKWGTSHITPALLEYISTFEPNLDMNVVKERIIKFRREKGDI